MSRLMDGLGLNVTERLKMAIEQTDLNELTEYWNAATRRLNGNVDDAFAESQNHAYELGLKRGRYELVELAKRLKKANAENDQKEWVSLHDEIYKLADA